MLQVTEEAMVVLKEVRSRVGAPAETGLRLHQTQPTLDGPKSVQMNFQEGPEPTDQTIETPEMKIFVSSELVEPLSDRVLDVATTHGTPQLMLR